MLRIKQNGTTLNNISKEEFLSFANKFFDKVKTKDGLIYFGFEKDE